MEAGAAAALRSYEESCPDVILVGVELNSSDGMEATRSLLPNIPNANIVHWFLDSDEEAVSTALQLGVRGIVSKTATLNDLREALKAVALGGTYYFGVPERIFTAPNGKNGQQAPKVAPREMRVLRMIAQGKSSKEIAVALQLEVETVRFYRKSMMRKLNAHNVATLLRAANTEGLIPLSNGTGE